MSAPDKPLRLSPSKYPWQRLLDEGGGELIRGVDYQCGDESLEKAARAWARNRSLTVTVRTGVAGVWFRFNEPG